MELLDDDLSEKRKTSHTKHAYNLFLISFFLWTLCYLVFGGISPQGMFQYSYIEIGLDLAILTMTSFGFYNGLKARSSNEPNSRERRMGIFGNSAILAIHFIVIFPKISRLMEILIP